MTDNDKSAFGFDDPNRGPLDRTANAIDGRDDPNRGPLDRADNAMSGHDDPNRGPLDRAANAVTGGTGGTAAAMGSGSASAQQPMAGGVLSAMFDSEAEAQRAISELREIGIDDRDVSLIAQSKRTMTTREGGGEVVDEEHSSYLRGILGGGALGAGLGVAALAIPGVGPLAALGAIAATAVPEAMAIGAVAGAAAGSFNEALKDHGVSDEDASYYGDGLKGGGVLVTVNADRVDRSQAQDVLDRNGGHSSARARTAVM